MDRKQGKWAGSIAAGPINPGILLNPSFITIQFSTFTIESTGIRENSTEFANSRTRSQLERLKTSRQIAVCGLREKQIVGPASSISEKLVNQLRRYGIRFYSRPADGVYRRWN